MNLELMPIAHASPNEKGLTVHRDSKHKKGQFPWVAAKTTPPESGHKPQVAIVLVKYPGAQDCWGRQRGLTPQQQPQKELGALLFG